MTPLRTILIIGLLILACPSLAAAQDTERELRRENEALRTQVTDLQAELRALKQENERLQAENQRLRDAIQAGRTGTAAPTDDQPPVTIDETVPNASPRALREALRASYAEATVDLEIGQPDSRERTLYLRQLERWQSQATRAFRSQIEWHVKVERDTNLARGELLVMAVDPKSGAELGDAFAIAVPRASMRRLQQMQDRRELDVLVMRGVLQPQLAIRTDREQPGAFDQDKFLAPFVLHGFAVDVQSLIPPAADDD